VNVGKGCEGSNGWVGDALAHTRYCVLAQLGDMAIISRE
jgi:hypothetical protein